MAAHVSLLGYIFHPTGDLIKQPAPLHSPTLTLFLPSLSLSLFTLSLPLFSALPSHIFRRPFDAFYFKAQRHRHIPLEETTRAAPRARPSAKSFDWLFLWSLSLCRPGHNLLEKSLCKNRNRPKAQGEITFPPSYSFYLLLSLCSFAILDKLLRARHKNKWKAISV